MMRPRLLLAGAAGAGQQQLAAAVLAAVEGLPVYAIGLPNLLAGAGSRSAFTVVRNEHAFKNQLIITNYY